jgi:hypothetical protein
MNNHNEAIGITIGQYNKLATHAAVRTLFPKGTRVEIDTQYHPEKWVGHHMKFCGIEFKIVSGENIE